MEWYIAVVKSFSTNETEQYLSALGDMTVCVLGVDDADELVALSKRLHIVRNRIRIDRNVTARSQLKLGRENRSGGVRCRRRGATVVSEVVGQYYRRQIPSIDSVP